MNTQAENPLETVLNEVIAFVFKEIHLLARYEAVLQQELGSLIPAGGGDAFEKRMNRVIEHLGGHPSSISCAQTRSRRPRTTIRRRSCEKPSRCFTGLEHRYCQHIYS